MGNCLKTQLKGLVNNPNLSRLGEQLFYVYSDGGYLRLVGNGLLSVRSTNGETFNVVIADVTVATGVDSFEQTINNQTVKINNVSSNGIIGVIMQDISSLWAIKGYTNLSYFVYAPNLTEFVINAAGVPESKIYSSTDIPKSIKTLSFGGSVYDFKIEDIFGLQLIRMSGDNLNGELLEYISSQIKAFLLYNGQILGDNWRNMKFNGTALTQFSYNRIKWEDNGDNTYLVTYDAGETSSYGARHYTATIDADGNVIS